MRNEEYAEERETVMYGAVVKHGEFLSLFNSDSYLLMSGFEFEPFLDERGENKSTDTMVETKKKRLRRKCYETEYEEDIESGKYLPKQASNVI